MAEAVVGPIIEVLLGKLLTLAADEFRLVLHFKDDLKKLQESIKFVQDLLHDAEEKQVTKKAVKSWLRDLEDLSFDADNVIDEIGYDLLSKQVKTSTENKKVQSCFSCIKVHKKVQSCFSCNKTVKETGYENPPILYRREMGRRIKDINESLGKINKSATDLGIQISLASSKDRLDAYENREENAFARDPIFLGRDNEVSEIVEMLTTTSPAGQKSYVLPIVGMGGLGKTTIAREVFHDERIISHFGDKNRVWVYVSQNFDVRNILQNILTSITNTEKFELKTQQDILKKLQEHWGAKKYLLVLDDVWKKNLIPGKVWDDFVNSLSGICSSSNGYCMIVTTRSEEVAASIVRETLPVHKLKGLPDDDCWLIIKGKSFGGGEILSDIEEIGKNIAKKCRGLPLAAKVVGGLLSNMKSKDEWSSIEKNWLSNPEDEKQISNVLKLSFDHLPSPSLKKCFAYCSIFPKGYNIKKEQLIELWMAEGFLETNHQKRNNNIDMETTGSKNFNILLQNSLLQHVCSDGYGNVTHCNMHDLVHDLACSILCEGVCKSRYVGYEPSGNGLLSIPKGQEKYVRTLFFDGKISDIKFSDFKSLHTLTLVGQDIDDLPTSIRELKHLRYLDISRTGVKCLSDSIGELYHMETLRAYGGGRNLENLLPDSLRCLINLRHLHISRFIALPPEIGKLTCLQTLPHFDVGGDKGCGISELGKLKYLKGELEIRNLEKVREKNEAMSADLLEKQGIYKLKLVWGRSERGDEVNDESVLEGLEPHPSLKSLEISGFNGKILPQWTSKMEVHLNGNRSWEALNNLMEIKLEGCSELEELPSLGQLRNLKSLELSGLTNVKSIRRSFYGIDNCANDIVVVFPALKRLVLCEMTNLKEWDEAGDLPLQPSTDEVVVVFPILEHLRIIDCKQLMRAPSHIPRLKELKIDGMESGLPLENICGMKLTTLTHLYISQIKELECLPDGLFSNNHNLSEVDVSYCPNMTHLVPSLILPGGSRAPSLRKLKIDECLSLRELPDDLHSLNSLETLMISDCDMLTNLPIEMLESLEYLELNGLSSLTQNASEVIGRCLHKMTRLTDLKILGVPKFSIINSSASSQHDDLKTIRSLKRLDMGPSPSDSDSHSSWNNVSFNETVDAMLLQFTSLRVLRLFGMEDWECLPDGIQHLALLQDLFLFGFGGIEALPEWFGNLSSLEFLLLRNFKRLRHLPSEQAMLRLSKLTILNICLCPLLIKEVSSNDDNNSERRQKIVDSEWPKISHIPHIVVN